MRPRSLFVLLFLFPASIGAQTPLWNQIKSLEEKGQFTQATQLMRNYLEENRATLSQEEKEEILWEIERLRRIRIDYNLTREKLIEELRKRVADFKEEEFEQWEQQGRFDFRIIDGEKFYMKSSVDNLFCRYPDIRKRRVPKRDRSIYEKALWENYLKVKEAGEASPDRLVYPQKFKAKMTVTVNKDAVPAGKTIRCWLPYPRSYPFQTDIEFLSSSPEVKWIDQPLSPIRSVYLEQKASGDQPTVFTISYTFKVYSVYSKVDPAKVLPYDESKTDYIKYTKERPPHVMFTPELRRLSHEIVGGETNPYLIAKRIYQWISRNIRYSYALEYSTIPNISMYCYQHRYGDCGQEGLLFITLCRMNGIPARWQSGWYIMPGGKSIHDWTEIYIEPYGWIPVDPYMGIYTTQYIETLSEDQKVALNEFYFGNIDHFRLVANSDHCMRLFPPKESFRSDDVDFQRGELEYDGGNIYFDQFKYELEIELIE